MIVIPLVCGEAEMDICIVLEDENLQRIRAYDPAEVVRSAMGPWADHAIRNVIVTYATPADMVTVNILMEQQSIGAAMQYLARGFRYRPDRGDTDQPYEVKPDGELPTL